ncbi:MAG: outer membrane lipoprotein chaperone LolA [Halofilum sp. (in: g-proteobacteria)]|nr:outer membrane lipoprotein chaperone LolA [Halofilum sp. (in: g-proteobacteria)]
MTARRIILILCLGLASLPASAGEAMERLQRFTDDLRSFQAGFVQTRYDEDNEPVRESQGVAWLQRPGLFRWHYEKPYQQTIVADGERLWVYDADLDQVTVRPMERALATAPIMLLSGSEPLSEQFEMRDLGRREGLLWVELRPRVRDSDFRRIFLGLDDETLKVMELHDQFDQATQIRFHHVDMNPEIDPARFEFTPPEGVDVIGERPGADGGGG